MKLPMAPALSFPIQLLLFLLLLLQHHLHLASSNLDNTSFIFQNGFPAAKMTLDGSATISPNGILFLTTNNTIGELQFGQAFLSTPLPFRSPSATHDKDPPFSSFSTTFVVAVVPNYQGPKLHRTSFLIAPRNHMAGGPQSKYFGLFNFTSRDFPSSRPDPSDHILEVEFRLNPNGLRKGLDNSHLDVIVNGAMLIGNQTTGYYSQAGEFTDITLLRGDPIQMWIEYNSSEAKLDITVGPINVTGKPGRPLCSADVNLTGALLDEMYVGFAGGTGLLPVSQYLLGWSFRLNGEAEMLDLPNLPRLQGLESHRRSMSLTVLLLLPSVVVLVIGVVYVVLKRREKYAEVLEDWELDYGPHRIPYKDLYRATKGFRESELLGAGGFGMVYRGELPGTKVEVAVKRVSHDSQQGMREFVAEVVSIGRLRHRNLVSLLGYCRRKGELLLVYDYMPNGSLDRFLFDNSREPLDWDRRFKIIKGVAAGLLYLHEEWEQVVVHRDVKAGNVLLDVENNGRLGDFGLARLYDHGTAPQTTHLVGTMGYLAPELSREGRASKATDVFAFGMFVLEVVCGRRPIEPRAQRSEVVLVDWVVRRWVVEGLKLVRMADSRMEGAFEAGEVEMVMKLGLLCGHVSEAARPSMRQAVQVLQGDLPVPDLPMDYWKGCFSVGGFCGGGDGETGGGFGNSFSVLSAASSSAAATGNGMMLSGGR